MFTCLYIFTLALWVAADSEGEGRTSRLVNTSQGPVRGYKTPDDELYVFHSIPYATAPTGPHRFKAPLPGPIWFQPLEAVDKGIVCPQADPFGMINKKTVQEDCLIANIYVPDTEETNLPVVVYVHGGAYQIGFGDSLTPKNLVKTKKIIAVTFNYRLGIHGFLCLGTEGAPGNAGMKDQVAILRWVNKNIANFGGNPNDVTLAGYSAGSSAVDLLMLSKTTRGLFNKVIPESGANVAAWSVQIAPLENAKAYAKKVNFSNVDNIYKLEEFYTTAPFELLTLDAFIDRTDATFVFSPCVERDTGVEKFLDDAPVNILKEGKYNKVPILYGFSNMEGLSRLSYFDSWKEKMNEKFSNFLPVDLQFDSEKQKDEIAEKVKEFYFGTAPIDEDNILGFINYNSDVTFAYSTLRSVKLHVEAGNDKIYLYEYSFPDEEMPPTPKINVRGANHCSQTGAVLDGIGMNSFADENTSSDEYKKMRKIMRELWLNFMTKGVPVPEGSPFPAWPAVGLNRAPHMSLGEAVELRGPLLQERTRFWEEIYDRHYRAPAPPPTPPPRPHSEL